ncbi:expressed protein [Phakopsora pachyrhizi]|uniref:Expressed protein n=1 Tax=Phakopsora pachyrhizi TaxID=170000 RepID=A0AAV0AP58_PHAPC|nr:expressed protein [Phakopsora pachyrhizi]
MKRTNYINVMWKINTLKLLFFIPIFNFVLSTKPFYDYDLTLAPQHGQVVPDLRSDLGSLSENSQYLQPLASNSAALTPNLESSFPHQPVGTPSWQDLAHQNNLKEYFSTHQNGASRHEKFDNFDAVLHPQISQAPLELISEISSLSKNPQLPLPLASNSAALTPSYEYSFPHQLVDFPLWQNLAHQKNHNENREVDYQNHKNYRNDYNYMSHLKNSNEASIINGFLDEGNVNGYTAKTNHGSHSSSHQNSNNQNLDWPFNNLLDFDPVDTQFNSMISAQFRTPLPHEQISIDEKIYCNFLDAENHKINYVGSLKKNKISSVPTEEVDDPQISLIGTSMNKEATNIFEIQKKVSTFSKSIETVEPLNPKRKFDRISESKSTKPNEQNTDDLEYLEPNGGSINQRLRLKNSLDGLVRTSGARAEVADEDLKMRLAEPVGTYKLLRSNQKIYQEGKTLSHNQQLNSSKPITVKKSARKKVMKTFRNSSSKIKYLIDDSYRDPIKRLKSLRNVLFEQLKLQQHNDLKSLDNFVEDLYRRAKSEFYPGYVLGGLVDWNVEKTIEERVKYILRHDDELQIMFNNPRMENINENNVLNEKRKAIFEKAEKKIKSFWNSYSDTFRHNYLPYNKKGSLNVYESLITEIGASSGENHLKTLNLEENINQVFESFLLEINAKPATRCGKGPQLKYQMVKNITLIVSNYIIIFYRIFTPFDNKNIEEMKSNLVLAIKNMEEFWKYVFAANSKVNAHKGNPFTKKNIFCHLPNYLSVKNFHYKRSTVFVSRKFFWNWMLDPDGMNIQFIANISSKRIKMYFTNFIEDCSIVDFLESSPLPNTNIINS